MRTFKISIILAGLLIAVLSTAGCGTLGENTLRGANPDAYDATRGGTTDGTSGGAFGAEPADRSNDHRHSNDSDSKE